MALEAYIVVVAIAAAYVVIRERMRLTASSLLLLGLWGLYGAGYFYYSVQADAWDRLTARVTVSLAVMWFGVILGMEVVRMTARQAIKRQQTVMLAWNTQQLRASANTRVVWFAWILAAVLIGGFFLFGRVDQIMEFFSAATEAERGDLRAAFSASGSYVYDVIRMVYAPFVCFYLFAHWCAARETAVAVACAVLAGAIAAADVATFHKLPWAFFLLQLFLVQKLTRQLSMNVMWIAAVTVFGVLALATAASIAYPQLDVPGIANYLLYRAAYITNEGLYQTLYVYPDYLPHADGYNIGLVQALFGTAPREPAHSVVAAFFGSPGSTFNALFIADAWVDFGLFGVLVVATVVGVVIKLSDAFYFQFGKTPLCIAGIVTSTWGVLQLLTTAAPTAFLSGGLVLLPLTIFIVRSVPPPPRCPSRPMLRDWEAGDSVIVA